jgi:hypothetical protein
MASLTNSAITRHEALSRLVAKCHRLEDPAPGVVDFLVKKAAGLLKENALGMVRAESFAEASRVLERSIKETSGAQRARGSGDFATAAAHFWGRDPNVRKDAAGAGSAATTGTSNGGTPPGAIAIWSNDPDEQKQELIQLAIVEVARINNDRQELPLSDAETLQILREANLSLDEQQFLVNLTPLNKAKLLATYKRFRSSRTFAKAAGDTGDSSFAAESSNGGLFQWPGSGAPSSGSPVSVTVPPLATAAGVTMPLADVRAPSSPGAVDTLARGATAATSPAGPVPTNPTAADDLGAGLDIRISAVAIAEALSAQGYSVDVEVIKKAILARGTVKVTRKVA